MNYTLNQLAVFQKVVEKKSITIAASDLFMTQPAVSIQLKNFQKNFNSPLYESKGRGIVITEFGEKIALVCQKIAKEAYELERLSFSFDNILEGKLRIASASTGKYVIPSFLTDFLSIHKNIELELNVSNKSEVLKALINNEIDFAVISVLPTDIDLHEEKLIDNMLFLTGKSNSNFNLKPLIFREKGSATRVAMEKFYTKPINAPKKIILQSNEAVKQAIIADLGVSILPLIGIKNEILNGQIKIIEQKGLPYKTKWRLVWLKNKVLSPVAQEYIQYIKTNKNKIISNQFSWYLNFTK